MSTITVTLSNEHLLELEAKAVRFAVTPEDLVRASIAELLARPDEAFQQAMNHVLQKNTELYRRLA